MTAPAIGHWEQRLERSGLASLDYDDGAGGLSVSNRGSGKRYDDALWTGIPMFERRSARGGGSKSPALLEQRRAMVKKALRKKGRKRWERKVLSLYASGLGTRIIPRMTGVGRMAVHRLIKRVRREQAMAPERSFRELLSACEPSTIVLFFWLLELALTDSAKAKALISQAREIPAIRELIEPEDVRMESADG